MKKYYIFSITKKNYDVYKNNRYSLYTLLKKLYYLDEEYLNYGVSVYDELCTPINKKDVYDCCNNYKLTNNKYYYNRNILTINNACMTLLSTNNNLDLLNNLKKYDKPLFICGFDSNEYFFL